MSIRITNVTITPVAFADPPLLNSVGVHEPFALRAIIEVATDAGIGGLGETYFGVNGWTNVSLPGQPSANSAVAASAADPVSGLKPSLNVTPSLYFFDANGVLAPHLDVDVAGEVVEIELGAFGDRHRLIGWRHHHQRQEKRCYHSRWSLVLSS